MQNEKFRQDRTPLYLKIAEVLRQRILGSHWKTGERLPTVNELMAEFEVARVTIREAVKILVSEGLVEWHILITRQIGMWTGVAAILKTCSSYSSFIIWTKVTHGR